MTGLDQDEMSKTLGIGQHKGRGRRVGLWAVLALFAAGLLAAWLWSGAQAHKVSYSTEPVARADVQVMVSAIGTIEPTDLVEISSELSGTVESVHVDFNDQVEVGTLLARLDTSKLEAQLAVQAASLASAEAKVAVSTVTLDEARQTYERGLELQQRGVESETTFIAQAAAYQRAQAELRAAEAARDLAQANYDVVKTDLEKACICSPVKGLVLDRDVDEGQIVAASLSAPILFTVAEDLSRMEVQVDIDEADIGMVAVGQSAVFTVEAYDERSFPAQITQLRYAPETVDGVVTYKAILSLDNSDMSLRPGMTASADIVVMDIRDALVVPNAALRYAPPEIETEEEDGRGASGLLGMIMPSPPEAPEAEATGVGQTRGLWVLRGDAPAEVAVTIGQSDGSVTVITDGDLAEGDRVITDRIDGN